MPIPKMTASKACLDLIKMFEGFRSAAYQDVAGIWTIGYGHTAGVTAGQTMSRDKAERHLTEHVDKVAHQVCAVVDVPLQQSQFDALCSLVYNIGAGNFQKSKLLQKLNAKEPPEKVAAEFLTWRRAGGRVISGLVKRREIERDLFLRDSGNIS